MIRLSFIFTLLTASLPAIAEEHTGHGHASPTAVADSAEVGDAGSDALETDALPEAVVAVTHTAQPAHHDEHASTSGHGEGHGGEHHAGVDAKTLALQLLNFGVLLFILIKFAGGGMKKAFRGKHDQLAKEIGEAAKAKDEAQRKAAEQEKRLVSLEKEIAALREGIHQDAEREKARILANAQEKAKRIQEDTAAQLASQVKAAEARLRAEVAAAAARMAEEMLNKQVGIEDERRLAKEFIAGFEASADAGKTVT